MNLVLADTEEFRRVKRKSTKSQAPGASAAPLVETEEKRTLGLTIVRGCHIVSLSVEGPPPADPSARLGTSAPGGSGAPSLPAGPGISRPAGRGLPVGLTGPAAGVGGPGPGGFGGFPPQGGFPPAGGPPGFAGRGGPPGAPGAPGFPPAGFAPGGAPRKSSLAVQLMRYLLTTAQRASSRRLASSPRDRVVVSLLDTEADKRIVGAGRNREEVGLDCPLLSPNNGRCTPWTAPTNRPCGSNCIFRSLKSPWCVGRHTRHTGWGKFSRAF